LAIIPEQITWNSLQFPKQAWMVRLEYLDGAVTFGAVPTWTLESIIPLSFGVMALRYFVFMLTEVKQWQS
jgi:hypothetical protein